ncbi:MAG: hypothetical protein LBS81_04710 [Endomicrobium sp.]|nr:hypothetical protein [Endomicrobium sp.]
MKPSRQDIMSLLVKYNNDKNNTVIFSSANVTLLLADYTGGTGYSFNNAVICLSSQITHFTSMTVNNSKLGIWVTLSSDSSAGCVLRTDESNGRVYLGEIIREDEDAGLSRIRK